MYGNNKVLDLFLEESAKHIECLESDLLLIKQNAETLNTEMVNKALGTLRTIKGGSSIFDTE